jgi:hypothetical protein
MLMLGISVNPDASKRGFDTAGEHEAFRAKASAVNRARGPKGQHSGRRGRRHPVATPTCAAAAEQAPATRPWPAPSP